MTKVILSLLIAIFLLGGMLLYWIFQTAQNDRHIRIWESFRIRGYEFLYQGQYDVAAKYFRHSSEFSRKLGKTNYRYAISMQDYGFLAAARGDYKKAHTLMQKALEIMQKRESSRQSLQTTILEDQILATCHMCIFTLKEANGSPDLAWQEFGSVLKLLSTHHLKDLDPIAARAVCETMIAIGDGFKAAGDDKLSISIWNQAQDFEQQIASLQDLSKTTQRRLYQAGVGTQSFSDSMAEFTSLLKAKQFDRAEDVLKAAEAAAKNQSELINKIRNRMVKLHFSQDHFEETEKIGVPLLAESKLDNDEKEELLTYLTMLYRVSSRRSDAAQILKQQYLLAKKRHGNGPESDKAALEAAYALQAANKFDEAKPICEYLKSTYLIRKKEAGDIGSEKLGAVLIRNGDWKIARPMLESLVGSYEPGSNNYYFYGNACLWDLAALECLEGKPKQCKLALEQSQSLTDEYPKRSRVGATDPMRDWCLFLKDKPEDDLFIKQALLFMPIPTTRREACRLFGNIADIETLRTKHPHAFTTEVQAHINAIKACSKEYPPAKLTGLAN